MTEFLTLAKERYSVRSFKNAPIEPEKLDKIIEAGLCAPTAVNFQPFRIWVFTSPEARAALAGTSKFGFLGEVPVILAIGAKEDEAWVRKYDGRNFADVDASIAATQMMLAIHDLGLGTTWVGHFDADEAKRRFPQLDGYDLIGLFPVGYPADDAKPSPKHSESRKRDEIVSEL